jgi:hypothetical protein
MLDGGKDKEERREERGKGEKRDGEEWEEKECVEEWDAVTVAGCVRVLADGGRWHVMRQREQKENKLVSRAMADGRQREREEKQTSCVRKVEKVIDSGLCSGDRCAKEAGMQDKNRYMESHSMKCKTRWWVHEFSKRG